MGRSRGQAKAPLPKIPTLKMAVLGTLRFAGATRTGGTLSHINLALFPFSSSSMSPQQGIIRRTASHSRFYEFFYFYLVEGWIAVAVAYE